jgi:hypothetical protein
MLAAGSLGFSSNVAAAVICSRTVTANVVAIDQPMLFSWLGAQNITYMTFALRRDVVNSQTNAP